MHYLNSYGLFDVFQKLQKKLNYKYDNSTGSQKEIVSDLISDVARTLVILLDFQQENDDESEWFIETKKEMIQLYEYCEYKLSNMD